MAIRVRETELQEEVARLTRENTRLHHEVSLRNSELVHVATGNWRLPCNCSAGMARTVSCGTRGHAVGTACGQAVKAQLEAARTSDKPATPQPAPDVQTALAKALEGLLLFIDGMREGGVPVIEEVDAPARAALRKARRAP